MQSGRRKALVAVGGLAIAVVFALGAMLPDWRTRRAAQQDARSLREAVDGRTAQLSRLAQSRQRSEELTRRMEAFATAIPGEQRIGGFLELLDAVARDVGLSGKNVQPDEAVHGPQVSYLPVRVDVTGSFTAVHEFLRRVESLPRLARAQRLEMTGDEEHPGELSASVMMRVYFRPS
jgi:Tfp pilus assembly protein PilO